MRNSTVGKAKKIITISAILAIANTNFYCQFWTSTVIIKNTGIFLLFILEIRYTNIDQCLIICDHNWVFFIVGI